MAVKVFNISLPWAYWIILPLTVWWIYITDHLMDGFKHKENTSNPRHRLFYRKRYSFFTLACLIGMADLILILTQLPKEIILLGAAVGTLVIIYLLLGHFIKFKSYFLFPKEWLIAALYTVGIWGVPCFLAPGNIQWFQWVPLAGYFMIVVSNLLTYSVFETRNDNLDDQISLVTAFNRNRSLPIIYWWCFTSLFFNGASILVFVTGSIQFYSAFILTLIQFIQIMVLLNHHWFEKGNRYRWINEGLFLLPAILLVLPN